MPKTRELKVTTSDEIRITAGRNRTTVHVEEPEVNDMLSSMDKEDIMAWVRDEGYSPDDVFADEDLHKWAEENGYTKA